MVKFFDSIPPNLQEWALKQAVFFTASAPTYGRHVNVSPKGFPAASFTIFGPNKVGYVDHTGSGIETISHIYENGRVTIMFCSFQTSPRILRFFCTGKVLEHNAPHFQSLLESMGKPNSAGVRAVILLDVWKVQTSCGFGVPYLSISEDAQANEEDLGGYGEWSMSKADKRAVLEDRKTLGHFWDKMAKKEMGGGEITAYRVKMNSRSLDGLMGMKVARKNGGERLWFGDLKQASRKIFVGQSQGLITGFLVGALFVLMLATIAGWRFDHGRSHSNFCIY